MDIRWIQRFNHYQKALYQLSMAVDLINERDLSLLEKQGVIHTFEFTHELSWKVLKDFLEDRGNEGIYGSRDAVRMAFLYCIIDEGDVWMRMIKSRNLTSHTYNEETANEIITTIITDYFSAFQALKSRLEQEVDK